MNARRRNSPPRNKRRALPALLAAVAVFAVIAIVLVVIFVKGLLSTPPEGPRGEGPSSSSQPPSRPRAQPADCPDVLTVVVPGTWESRPNDNPLDPTAKPASLLLKVSTPLKEEFTPSRATIYTVPYLAEFRNPTNLSDHQADYNVSRAQGYKRAAGKIISTHDRCPLTRYVIFGFSQGAVIAGDLASAIGNGRGVLPSQDADLVLGVGLLADGRRESAQQRDIGPNPPGVGAEVSLGGLGTLVPGISMTGSRDGGFGAIRDRVVSICAPGDLVCDAPTVANPIGAVGRLINALNNPVHAMYATPKYWSIDGTTATQWLYGWASRTIDEAPHPAHR